jgi:hypothetical protein
MTSPNDVARVPFDRTRLLRRATAAAIARTGIERDQPSFHVAFWSNAAALLRTRWYGAFDSLRRSLGWRTVGLRWDHADLRKAWVWDAHLV